MKKRTDKKEKANENDEENPKKQENKEDRKQKQSQTKNSAQANMILIKEKLAGKNVDKDSIKEMIFSIKIRGIRQRAKKLVQKHFGENIFAS